MKHFHKNPRVITSKQMTALRVTMADLGDLSGITHDLDTDEILTGNQRMEVIPGAMSGVTQPTITERFDPPLADGTALLGYYEYKGLRFQYRAVKGWDDDRREEAVIVANKAGGTWDFDKLANEFEFEKLISYGFEEKELSGFDEEDNNYSRKIEPPDYQVTGEKPALGDLFDSLKTQRLIQAIDAAEHIPEDEKEFLRIAAQRHTVLHFRNIAEYYAHSSAEMQALMEDNTLVIIDFNKAIAQGYIELTKAISDLVKEESGDE